MPQTKEFTRRDFFKMAGAASLGLAMTAAPGARDAEAGSKQLPNILLLMDDQHRGDCLGVAGNGAIHTPNLDRLAREGVWFSNAYSSTPTCTPARAALLTGLSPWRHGMLGYGQVAQRYPVELPRALSAAGYYTYAIGKLHYHPQRNYHGFQGALLDESGRVETPDFVSDYRKWFKEQAPSLNPDATGISWNDYRARRYALPEELHPTIWTGNRAVQFIKDYKRTEPFALKVSFARPHSPYDPPAHFFDSYADADVPAPNVGDWAAQYAPAGKPNFNRWCGDLGVAQAKRSRRGYYGSVSFVDEQIGRIVRALEERRMLENTFILFLSDHGDMTGDHNLWRKSYAYEASTHIPLLLRWPKSMDVPSKRGVTRAEPVEIRDVLPTLLEVAGTTAPRPIDGRSLLDLLRRDSPAWRDCIDLEHDICYSSQNHWNALTDGKWKYIYHAYDGHEQLFHLSDDPGELRDLVSQTSRQAHLKEWRARMVDHLTERGPRWVKDGRLITRPQSTLYSPLYPGKTPSGQ